LLNKNRVNVIKQKLYYYRISRSADIFLNYISIPYVVYIIICKNNLEIIFVIQKVQIGAASIASSRRYLLLASKLTTRFTNSVSAMLDSCAASRD